MKLVLLASCLAVGWLSMRDAAAERRALAVTPLVGPLETEAYCKSVQSVQCAIESDIDVPAGPTAIAGRKPFTWARIVRVGEDYNHASHAYCSLGLQLGQHFYFLDRFAECRDFAATSSRTRSLDFVDQTGANPVFVLRLVRALRVREPAPPRSLVGRCEELLVVCGVGASGTPSCAKPLTIAEGPECGTDLGPPGPAPTWTWELSAVVTPAGALVIERKTGRLGAEARALVGQHALKFP
jgi:hypothetical protein